MSKSRIMTSRYRFIEKNPLWMLCLYILLAIGLFSLYYYLMSSHYLDYYFTALAASVYWIFSFFDSNVAFQKATIYYDGAPALIIIKGCDGLAVVFLVVSAVLSFPRSLKSKVRGILVLIPLLLMINLLRIIMLAAIHFYAPSYFDVFHLYFFQTVMIAAACLGFFCWIVYSEKSRFES